MKTKKTSSSGMFSAEYCISIIPVAGVCFAVYLTLISLDIPVLWAGGIMLAMLIIAAKPAEIFTAHLLKKKNSPKKINYTQLLRSLGETLIKVNELDPLCRIMSNTITEILDIKYFILYVYNRTENCYMLKTEHNIPMQFPLMYDRNDSIIRFISLHNGILAHSRATNTQLQNALASMHAKICIPLKSAHRLIGFALIGDKVSNRSFTHDDIAAFQAMQKTAATALENALTLEKLKEDHNEHAQKEKLATVSTLAAGIKHEINNPLFVILGRTEMLLRHSLQNHQKHWNNEKLLEYVEKQSQSIQANADRIKNIISRIADFSKPIHEAHMTNVNVLQTLNDAIKLLGYSDCHLTDIYFAITIDPHLMVRADGKMLLQIFFNLINNAIHAMNFTGTVTIAASEDTLVHIRVQDNGIGIDHKNIKRIFDPFFTTKDNTQGATNTIKGTGLGLHLVYNYITQMRAQITVESTPNKGTTLHMTFDKPK